MTKTTSTKIESTLTALFGARRPTKWVTREHPKIDRIACPWLIRRFIDADAVFLYVPTAKVFDVAKSEDAVAFDITGGAITHSDGKCSFDAFIERFDLHDAGLQVLAPIVRGADTDDHALAPEAAGLHAISLGLATLYDDDHKLLAQGMILYDALYAWAIKARGERHTWKPAP